MRVMFKTAGLVCHLSMDFGAFGQPRAAVWNQCVQLLLGLRSSPLDGFANEMIGDEGVGSLNLLVYGFFL